jgi:hypothetical protein
MRIILFIPSYNDTKMAYEIALQFLKNRDIARVLIVDDSDDAECRSIAGRIKNQKIDVLQRTRAGKWSAWKIALETAREYDGLIEIDSDAEVENTDCFIASLHENDLVTAYPNIVLPPSGLGRMIGLVYRGMHEDMKSMERFSMGGQLIALSKKTVKSLLKHGFFEEPVASDDHVVALGACVLGLKCATIDCGLRIRLPLTLKEWIKFRSRHRGAIKRAEQYVSSKTGERVRTTQISRSDFNRSYGYFVMNLVKSLKLFAPLVALLFVLGSILPLENQTQWSRLKGERT